MESIRLPKHVQRCSNTPQNKHMYNLKIVTSTKRNSGISYPNAGVQMLFINDESQSYIHSVSRTDDTSTNRFETGHIDELAMECDDLGDIDQLWVFPEEGTWGLECVVIHDLSTNEQYRFDCDTLIGTDENPAIIMYKNELDIFDQQKYLVGMNDYTILKRDLLQINVGLVVGGFFSLLAFDPNIAKSFIEGGLVGILYLYLLEKQTDYLGSTDKALLFPLVSGPIRLIAIAYLSISSDVFDNPELLIPYACGFFMYKVAVLGVGIRDWTQEDSSHLS